MVLVAVTVYCKVLDRGLWKADTDESGAGLQLSDTTMPESAPSVIVALSPVLLPVVLILINTVADAMLETTPVLISFLGAKTIALLAGALSAYIIAVRTLDRKGAQASAEESLKSAGIVFLITGAGGSVAQVISASGVNNAIVEMVSNVPGGVKSYTLGQAIASVIGIIIIIPAALLTSMFL